MPSVLMEDDEEETAQMANNVREVNAVHQREKIHSAHGETSLVQQV